MHIAVATSVHETTLTGTGTQGDARAVCSRTYALAGMRGMCGDHYAVSVPTCRYDEAADGAASERGGVP